MLTSRRDYVLRLIDEAGEFFRRALAKRQAHSPQEALEAVVAGCERLFDLPSEQLFQFTPDQQVLLLVRDEPTDVARDKILLYAALCAEAAGVYTQLDQPTLARGSLVNALRLTLRAQRDYASPTALPAYAPDADALADQLGRDTLDDETAMWLQQRGSSS
ncbi:hypothetical protein K0B96_08965 [Horticoccus luteus]|uniref:Uncharacterized protein n=1 Tax=Horticoccus luteus TaxID=2862869 RepID=A0A8F9XMV8_9BACT|nr:hypothetical protein [Horticoccus luteus]QYM80711.1 hypothetical protein K0B96_08965 [Horticoccus luteus]